MLQTPLRIDCAIAALALAAVTGCSAPKVVDESKPAEVKAPPEVAKVEPKPEPEKPIDLPLPTIADGVKADRILVDKSDRLLILYKGQEEIARYDHIRFGDAPKGHKQFEGDEKTPEGTYTINGRNPGSSFHLSLRVSYPNAADRAYAEALGRDPGGDIFIHGQPNGYDGPPVARDWTDGCIALSNAEIKQIWDVVPDGAEIVIRP